MSNRRKSRKLNVSSGLLQRAKLTWSGQPGNRTTALQIRQAEEEASKPKFILQPKQTRTDQVIYDESGST